jgi:CheY-like chemotaxis protein
MSEPIKLLLVEDSPDDIILTEEALKDASIETRLSVVTDGEQAMDYLYQRGNFSDATRPDVILLDLNMPRKNGHDVLAEMKDDPDLEGIPVIVLTVSQEEADVVKAMNLKMNFYLNKPVATGKLEPLLQEIHDLWS